MNDYKKMLEEQKNKTNRERVDYQYNQKREFIEKQLLRFIKNDALYLFVAGGAGTRFVDEDDLAFTNAGIVLNAIYNIYIKYPELNIDNLLENALIILLQGEIGYVYTALNTIDTQLYNEKRKTAPFKLDNPELFFAIKESVQKNIDTLKNLGIYKGKLYDRKLYGYVEDLDQKIEEQKGIKIL